MKPVSFVRTSPRALGEQDSFSYEHPLSLDAHFIAHPTSTFFVQAGGEVGSLDALDICCGDILVVDRAVLPHDGQVALVFRDGELALDVWGSGTSCELWGTVVAFARRLS